MANMSFIQILIGALFVFLVSGLPTEMHSTRQGPVSSKPGLELIFTGQINLADFSPPIPIPAGQRIGRKSPSNSEARNILKLLTPLTIRSGEGQQWKAEWYGLQRYHSRWCLCYRYPQQWPGNRKQRP